MINRYQLDINNLIRQSNMMTVLIQARIWALEEELSKLITLRNSTAQHIHAIERYRHSMSDSLAYVHVMDELLQLHREELMEIAATSGFPSPMHFDLEPLSTLGLDTATNAALDRLGLVTIQQLVEYMRWLWEKDEKTLKYRVDRIGEVRERKIAYALRSRGHVLPDAYEQARFSPLLDLLGLELDVLGVDIRMRDIAD